MLSFVFRFSRKWKHFIHYQNSYHKIDLFLQQLIKLNMIQKITPFILLVLLCFSFNRSYCQQAILSSGGNSTDGTVSYSFGQFAYQTFFESNSSIAQGVQHVYEISSVPSLFSLTNTLISTNETFCYNALMNITIAGVETSVLIQEGATANFIAGHSIRFLPGFNAKPGSYVHAYITQNGEFCDGPITGSIVQASPEEKSEGTINPEELNKFNTSEKQVIVFPNPNNGTFNVTLLNFENSASICIYNLTGAIFYNSNIEQTTLKEITLPTIQKGIYFVRVTSNKEQFVKKIIIK